MTVLPATMTAISVPTPGGPEVLAPRPHPIPQPGEGEMLVRVHAAGVNRPDALQRRGEYRPPKGASEILGLELAGEVVALGPGVTRFALGDKVAALVSGGAYAEYCVVPEGTALPVPPGLSMIEAAALPEAVFTVWMQVFEMGRLAPGETLLVHGGSSGIGTTAIRMAKAFGAMVVVTAGSEEKCAACRRLGADLAVNYRTEDFVEATKTFTNGRGADVILDMVGGDYINRNYEAAAENGRIQQIAFMAGNTVEVDFRRLMRKGLTHSGALLRPRPAAFKARLAAAVAEKVWPLVDAGTVRPAIDSTFPLADAAGAHRRLESSEHIGKIVLTV
ncbi:MAG: NAD(P)H-quinone oxidoreductase [Bauldia sp.]|nr:NAD(P)H-quinone oxidoreductase [Bauldia sp.]